MDIVENIANAIGWLIIWAGVGSFLGLSIVCVIGLSNRNR